MPDEISLLSEDEYFNIEEVNLNEIVFDNTEIIIIDENSNNQEFIEIEIKDEDSDELESSIQSISKDETTKIIEDGSHLKLNQISVTCTNCEKLFTSKSFEEHICDYDENKMLIEDNFEINFSPDPICIRQLRDNNLKIRKFLKDELKVDLKSSITKSDGPHECNLCERKFVHVSGLIRHMEKHSVDTVPKTNVEQQEHELNIIVRCVICGRVFPDMKNAFLHIQENHEHSELNENEFSDEEEEEDLPYKIIKGVITGTVFQCEFCDYLFADELHLLRHESIHDPLIGYECSFCKINVSTLKEISTHWHTECAFTRYETKRNISMPKVFLCNVCGLKFNSLEQLYDHRYTSKHFFPRSSFGSLKINCETCGLFFDRAELLSKHYQENHLKIIIPAQEQQPKSRQYLCDVCGKTYTQSSHLWQHLRFHRGVKPFACKEEGCERRFTIRPDLNDHIRKCHTGERPYHCEICGKRFLTGSVYYQHRLIHRGERRYGCTECDKRFYRADALKNHSLIHSGKKPYPCSFCEKAFRQKGDRDKHVKARHSHAVPQNQLKNLGEKKSVNLAGLNGVPFPASMFIIPNLVDIDGNVN